METFPEQRGNPLEIESFREQFPITERYIYMNNAAVAPLSTPVAEAREEVSRILMEEGTGGMEKIKQGVEDTRRLVGELTGVREDEIAFTGNTTRGILIAANGIPWRKGDNLVMPGMEFPANVYPWMAISERKDVELRRVAPIRGRVTAEMLMEACDRHTRAVTVSLVQYSSGYRIDAEKLGAFCREREIFLHLDAIQALGMIDCRIPALRADLLSAGAHKWLMALPGTAIFYCRREILDQLEVYNPGWTSVENFMDLQSYRLNYRKSAGRFEEGSLNFHGIMGLGASAGNLLKAGMARVEKYILSLTASLERELRDNGFVIQSPRSQGHNSGIICFSHPRRDTGEIFQQLTSHGITASIRGGAVRLSPHVFNTDEEVKKVIEALTAD